MKKINMNKDILLCKIYIKVNMMAYSSKKNGIAEHINGLVASKTRYLLLDSLSKIG